METNHSGVDSAGAGRLSLVGVAGTLALVALSGLAYVSGIWKVLVISWVAFAAMAIGTVLGARAEATAPYKLVWGYGVASGAMITSAAMFLLPQAIGIGGQAGAPQFGGIGVALGIVAGYSAHTIGHRLTHLDVSLDLTAAQIAAHALSAGAIIGLVYGSMPSLGLVLGLAIVSHKGPAGYAAMRRLRRAGKPASALLLPAAGVGITAIPAALLPVPDVPALNAVIFGFAAGVFLHVAMDFLPNCEAGSEIDEVCSLHEGSHDLLDQLRTHAVGSTALGAAAVVVGWLVVS
ncbi:ZIP family metal transporter [Haloarculaceae archaeon H-GB2-1]|nr:ZIP family metal transporter [Haloarculaceae archaeon H-GB1-1]MEA5387199.1 ZIP family metal transporter [Haloarculaceae archaeon H-GB11]MEA5408695.1 ZIP family metal transporter [Haloarculaceae archaeon H-GB2-1]